MATADTHPADPAQLPIGTTIGNSYTITGVLGRGGFATVYSGQQLDLDRPVAIKLLDPMDDEENRTRFLIRFLREAQIAAGIDHPNVVTIYAHGLHTETHQAYIVMDKMRGHDLSHELKTSGALSPARIWKLLIPCLDALGDVHEKGIIHKDLKPGNFFLVHPNHPYKEMLRLLDFGVARIQRHEVTRVTGAGKFIGTPRYLAPEYIRDEEISSAVDVYQMGLILAEMLLGYPIVRARDPLEALKIHLLGELDLPEPLMTSPLGPVLRRATALNPEERYSNAHELRDVLQQIDPNTIKLGVLAQSALQSSDALVAPLEQASETHGPPTIEFAQEVTIEAQNKHQEAAPNTEELNKTPEPVMATPVHAQKTIPVDILLPEKVPSRPAVNPMPYGVLRPIPKAPVQPVAPVVAPPPPKPEPPVQVSPVQPSIVGRPVTERDTQELLAIPRISDEEQAIREDKTLTLMAPPKPPEKENSTLIMIAVVCAAVIFVLLFVLVTLHLVR